MNPIHIDATLIASALSFLLLVWLLSKLAWNPLMKVMEERRNFIESSLAQAQAEREQAEKIKQEYQDEIRKARLEAQELIERAAKSGEERASEILAQAKEEAEKIKQSALQDIERERLRAIADVRSQVADLSVAVAEKIIRQQIDVKGQEQLINQFIEEVGEMSC